jgi:formate hydrogenlyase subunit 3/multisubunit Na+/H+ antiporter MnhD subunit
MISFVLVAPLFVPLITAIMALLAWNSPATQRRLGLLGSAGLLIAAIFLFRVILTHGPQSTQIGGCRLDIFAR